MGEKDRPFVRIVKSACERLEELRLCTLKLVMCWWMGLGIKNGSVVLVFLVCIGVVVSVFQVSCFSFWTRVWSLWKTLEC